MLLGIMIVAEIAEFTCPARIRNALCILMAAEMAEHAFPGWIRVLGVLHSGFCRDGCFLSAQTRALFGILTVAEMAEYSIPARIRQYLWHADGCRDGGICVFSVDPQSLCFLHSDGCIDGGICDFSADP